MPSERASPKDQIQNAPDVMSRSAVKPPAGGVANSCAMLVQDYVQAVQWSGAPAIAQNIETERLHILNTYKCSSGESNRQTCQQYMGTIQQIQNAQHDTSTTIINNIGNKCRVGVDPGCVP